MLNSAGNRLVHFIFTNSHVQPSYNESRGEVMLEGLVLLPPRRNDIEEAVAVGKLRNSRYRLGLFSKNL